MKQESGLCDEGHGCQGKGCRQCNKTRYDSFAYHRLLLLSTRPINRKGREKTAHMKCPTNSSVAPFPNNPPRMNRPMLKKKTTIMMSSIHNGRASKRESKKGPKSAKRINVPIMLKATRLVTSPMINAIATKTITRINVLSGRRARIWGFMLYLPPYSLGKVYLRLYSYCIPARLG